MAKARAAGGQTKNQAVMALVAKRSPALFVFVFISKNGYELIVAYFWLFVKTPP
jgi:hypothetical protein